MRELIEALTIISKYGESEHQSIYASDDELMVCPPEMDKFTEEDYAALERLGFGPDDTGRGFVTNRYGSC